MAAGLLCTANPAAAIEPYIEAGIGWDYASSITLDSNEAEIEFDRGVFQFSGAVGARLGNRFRVELEYVKHENSPEILYSELAGIELDSDRKDAVRATSGMLNVLHEFKLGPAFQPYLGLGVGVADVNLHFSESRVEGLFIQRPRRDVIDSSTTTLAWQVIAGMSVPVTKHIELAADYRYWKAPDVDLTEVTGAAVNTSHSVQSAWLRVRYRRDAQPWERNRRALVSDTSRLYLTAYAGGGFAEDMGLEGELTIDAFDPGPVSVLALGYRWRDRFRFELEAGFRQNDVEVIELGPDIGEDGASGDARFTTLMANIRYRFGRDSLVQPFVGVGAGWLQANIDTTVFGFCESFVCGDERRGVFVDDKDSSSAYQVFAGVDVAMTDKLTFTADYRYLVSSSLQLQRPDGDIFEGDVRHTSVMVGLRYSL